MLFECWKRGGHLIQSLSWKFKCVSCDKLGNENLCSWSQEKGEKGAAEGILLPMLFVLSFNIYRFWAASKQKNALFKSCVLFKDIRHLFSTRFTKYHRYGRYILLYENWECHFASLFSYLQKQFKFVLLFLTVTLFSPPSTPSLSCPYSLYSTFNRFKLSFHPRLDLSSKGEYLS